MKRLAILLAALLAAAPVGAQNTGLTRLTLRDARLGWEAVGRLDLAGTGFCSGVLIAPDLVLTAGHCLTQAQRHGDVAGITFRAGFADGASVAAAAAARAVVHPGYLPGIISAETVAHDVALIELASPIPAAVAAPFALSPLPATGAEVSVVSYGEGRMEAPSRQAVCSVLGRAEALLAFDCDVTFGSSGAPIFETSGPRARIVSLVSAGGRSATGVMAFGMALPERVAELRHAFATGEGVFPQTSFTARRLGVGGEGGRDSSGARFVRP